jgi:hypothetical protein
VKPPAREKFAEKVRQDERAAIVAWIALQEIEFRPTEFDDVYLRLINGIKDQKHHKLFRAEQDAA